MYNIIQQSLSNLETDGEFSILDNYFIHIDSFRDESNALKMNPSWIISVPGELNLLKRVLTYKKIRKLDKFAFSQIEHQKSLISNIDIPLIAKEYSNRSGAFIDQINYLFDQRNLSYTEFLAVFHYSISSVLKPLSKNISEYSKCRDLLNNAIARLSDDTVRIRERQKSIFKRKLKALSKTLNSENSKSITNQIHSTMRQFDNVIIVGKKEVDTINLRIDIALSEIDECKKMYSQVISAKQMEELDSVTHSLRLCRADSIESKFVYNRLIEAETSFHSIKTDIVCNNNRLSVLKNTSNYTSELVNGMRDLSDEGLYIDPLPEIPTISASYSNQHYRSTMERFNQIIKSLTIIQSSD